ncbi:hypothetical protein FLP10_10440 [Agromyces intestinalis]|uniref:Uncharacterized protein n=1 Tax=Agromyces intestinalis TaxID=2592652 RepID=A0A5C1YHA1_9MICO|nr:hypothetical protein [Agromyces intestinalis]QEO14780.1 hypothetical protein FLP10_10440 [Agromyces intestinalis]
MHAWTRVAYALGVACASVVLVGCGASADRAAVSSAPGSTAAEPETAWLTFTTADGLASWQLPADWTVLPPGPDPDGQGTMAYEILNAVGESRLSYAHNMWGIGGPGCDPSSMPTYPYARLDETAMAIPPDSQGVAPIVAFETLDEGDHVVAGLGSTVAPIAGPEACDNSINHLVFEPGEVGGVSFSAHFEHASVPSSLEFANLDEARAYLDSDEYRTIVRIISSLSFDPIDPSAPVATATPVVPTVETSPLAGDYVIAAQPDDCGTFPLTGQILTVSGADASMTTPGQVLHGTLTRISTVWEVRVAAADEQTMAVLDGVVVDGVFRGSGSTSGLFPSGEVGWFCAVDMFTATSMGAGGDGSSTEVTCSAASIEAARTALGADAEIDPAAQLCSGDWMVLGVIRSGNEHTSVLQSVGGAWQRVETGRVCAIEEFEFDPEVGPLPGDTYHGPLPQPLVTKACFSN